MKVYSSPNLAMVGHFKNVLEMYSIACDIRGEYRCAAAGEIPPIECWPELWVVEESQAEQARQIIREALEPTENDPGLWKCPSCDEEVEGQFTECWDCGTNRPDDEDTFQGATKFGQRGEVR
ncbi:DUF2007 domain-containing protein [Acidobacteria bacterium AH-259-O06]|nr:DUF2007 domain-containing protein [Acidobacteria bacterium AH-259-O06]